MLASQLFQQYHKRSGRPILTSCILLNILHLTVNITNSKKNNFPDVAFFSISKSKLKNPEKISTVRKGCKKGALSNTPTPTAEMY
jgi:CRISPR/Cas system CMR-associated protein Cmr5 small subunit